MCTRRGCRVSKRGQCSCARLLFQPLRRAAWLAPARYACCTDPRGLAFSSLVAFMRTDSAVGIPLHPSAGGSIRPLASRTLRASRRTSQSTSNGSLTERSTSRATAGCNSAYGRASARSIPYATLYGTTLISRASVAEP